MRIEGVHRCRRRIEEIGEATIGRVGAKPRRQECGHRDQHEQRGAHSLECDRAWTTVILRDWRFNQHRAGARSCGHASPSRTRGSFAASSRSPVSVPIARNAAPIAAHAATR